MTQRVLAASAGLVHPSLSCRRKFRRIINTVSDTQTAWTADVLDLAALEGGAYDGAILYFHRKTISDEALEALDRFVTWGGGLLAVHSA